MGFSRQEYWSGVAGPGDLPDPGIKPVCPALAEGFFSTEPSGKTEGKRETLQTALFTARQSAPLWGTNQVSLKPGESLKEF